MPKAGDNGEEVRGEGGGSENTLICPRLAKTSGLSTMSQCIGGLVANSAILSPVDRILIKASNSGVFLKTSME